MSLLSRKRLEPLAMIFRWLCVLLAFLPVVSQAAQWSLKSSIDQFLGYDTNVQMRVKEQGSFHYKIVPVLTFAHKTEVSEIKAEALYGTQVYSDFPGFDQDFQNYNLSGSYKTELFDWGLALNHSDSPVRNNAVQSSGNFTSNASNISQSVAPSVTYHINEVDTLSLSPSYTVTTFSKPSANVDPLTNGANSTFRDYNILNINLAWQHLWTERYNTSVSLFYTNLDSQRGTQLDPTVFSYDSYGINLTNAYDLSQQWKLSGTIGLRQTESQGETSLSSSSVGFLADLNANYTGDNLSSGINFSRSLAPSFQGRLQEQTAFNWGFAYKISERLSADFNFNYMESTQVNNLINERARTNISLQPSINWKLTPEWTLSGSYRYRTQDSAQDQFGNLTDTGPSRSAESHLIMLTINFNWQGLNFSR